MIVLLFLFSLSAQAATEIQPPLPNLMLKEYPPAHALMPAEIQLPNRAKRVQALERAGLDKEIAQMDELDRDLLVMRAQQAESAAELEKQYPKLPKAKLEKLQRFLTRETK
jgi:hypothetical protein